jgi:hypothetical protein
MRELEMEKKYLITQLAILTQWFFPIPKELEDLIVEEYRNKSTNYPAADGILD